MLWVWVKLDGFNQIWNTDSLISSSDLPDELLNHLKLKQPLMKMAIANYEFWINLQCKKEQWQSFSVLKSVRKIELGCSGLLGDIPVSIKNLPTPIWQFFCRLCMCNTHCEYMYLWMWWVSRIHSFLNKCRLIQKPHIMLIEIVKEYFIIKINFWSLSFGKSLRLFQIVGVRSMKYV